MRVVNLFSIFLVAAMATSSQAQTPTTPDGVLVLRYVWSPMFCFAGSANSTPREFCGFDPPALTRFTAHRARLLYSNSTGSDQSDCVDPTSGYTPAAVTGPLRSALSCIDNSYTIGNDDAWHDNIWKASGTCAATAIGLNATQYFQIAADTFQKYNVDVSNKTIIILTLLIIIAPPLDCFLH